MTAHAGELAARQRFTGGGPRLDDATLAAMVRDSLPPSWQAFIAAQPFFFLATADDSGRCDAGFRGREHDASGRPLPAIAVLDERRLLFPDFSGNTMFSALGNMLVNPHVGLLFMDFARPRRLRVNGRAEIVEDSADVRRLWPTTGRGVLVTVEEAFGNCTARIPRLLPAEAAEQLSSYHQRRVVISCQKVSDRRLIISYLSSRTNKGCNGSGLGRTPRHAAGARTPNKDAATGARPGPEGSGLFQWLTRRILTTKTPRHQGTVHAEAPCHAPAGGKILLLGGRCQVGRHAPTPWCLCVLVV